MSCIVNILDVVLQGETPGGTLVFLFYDADQDGDADNGGSVVNIANDGSVNFEGYIPGDYYFQYTVGDGDCEETGDPFFVRVLPRADAGLPFTIDLCDDDDPINLFSLLLGTPDSTGSWSGPGTNTPGYIPGAASPTDDLFDPTLVPVGIYTFTYTVLQIVPGGFILSDCDNCDPASATITINVETC